MAARRSVTYEAAHCTLTIRRPAEGVVLIVITGSDVGELGDEPFRELAADFVGAKRVRLFIDARATQGVSVNVSSEWAAWLRRQQEKLAEVHMLVSARFVQVTADFVRRFSGLGETMRIYTVDDAFDQVLTDALV